MLELFAAKFPEYRSLPQPDPAEMRLFMVMPEVISLLDYRKGFGHSDLVTVTEADRDKKALRTLPGRRCYAQASALPTGSSAPRRNSATGIGRLPARCTCNRRIEPSPHAMVN